ncbi:hypothetical protein FACS189434_14120 [Bacteroidia bacterium]|nr:hypothetical protein FACS189434_14120 [Bacteroidia bacterium]
MQKQIKLSEYRTWRREAAVPTRHCGLDPQSPFDWGILKQVQYDERTKGILKRVQYDGINNINNINNRREAA